MHIHSHLVIYNTLTCLMCTFYILNIYSEERTAYHNWGPDQPGKPHWNCVSMQKSSGWMWYDYPCNDSHFDEYRFQYICQFGKHNIIYVLIYVNNF